MNKPIILLYTNVYDTTVGQGKAYMKFFSQFGDVLLVTSEMNLERMIELGDILALPGGQDINSDKYGARPGFMSKEINVHYEYLDKYLLSPWIETGKPIIGICRGMQALNVACGGTLHRHISGHVQSDDEFYRWSTPQKMYTCIVDKGKNPLYPIVQINTYHHQAVNKLAPGFQIIGWSEFADRDPAKKSAEFEAHSFYKEKDNSKKIVRNNTVKPMVPEIMEHTELPYIAFQYHPEETNCELAIMLINETLNNYYGTEEEAIEEKASVGQ